MAAPRTDSRGSLVSQAGMAATMTIVGLPELEKALKALGDLGIHGAMTAVVGTDLTEPPYPYFLEYGTSRMPAYPAARPAFDEQADTAIRTTADVLGQLIAAGQRDPGMVIGPALTEGARPIENRWKELARYLTGTYKRSVHTVVVDGIE